MFQVSIGQNNRRVCIAALGTLEAKRGELFGQSIVIRRGSTTCQPVHGDGVLIQRISRNFRSQIELEARGRPPLQPAQRLAGEAGEGTVCAVDVLRSLVLACWWGICGRQKGMRDCQARGRSAGRGRALLLVVARALEKGLARGRRGRTGGGATRWRAWTSRLRKVRWLGWLGGVRWPRWPGCGRRQAVGRGCVCRRAERRDGDAERRGRELQALEVALSPQRGAVLETRRHAGGQRGAGLLLPGRGHRRVRQRWGDAGGRPGMAHVCATRRETGRARGGRAMRRAMRRAHVTACPPRACVVWLRGTLHRPRAARPRVTCPPINNINRGPAPKNTKKKNDPTPADADAAPHTAPPPGRHSHVAASSVALARVCITSADPPGPFGRGSELVSCPIARPARAQAACHPCVRGRHPLLPSAPAQPSTHHMPHCSLCLECAGHALHLPATGHVRPLAEPKPPEDH